MKIKRGEEEKEKEKEKEKENKYLLCRVFLIFTCLQDKYLASVS